MNIVSMIEPMVASLRAVRCKPIFYLCLGVVTTMLVAVHYVCRYSSSRCYDLSVIAPHESLPFGHHAESLLDSVRRAFPSYYCSNDKSRKYLRELVCSYH